MGINVEEKSNCIAPKEDLIETKYIGTDPTLKKTIGQAFLDIPNNQWNYRPFGTFKFVKVAARALDCANDSGWVNGSYLGAKNISKVGKAYWSEQEDAWVYKPKGQQKTFVIPDNEFKMVRDRDTF